MIRRYMELYSIFKEWDIYAKNKNLHPRTLDFTSIIQNSHLKIIALTGIRRSGKTSMLMLLAQHLTKKQKNVCYINLEDDRLRYHKNVLDDIIKFFGDEGYLLLDEITEIDGWQGWLSRIHELYKTQLHVIVSSSRNTLSKPTKPLRGRLLVYELYPLSFQEYLSFNKISQKQTTVDIGKREKAFHIYQQYGGFPEVTLTTNPMDKIRILHGYFRDIIGLDIAEMSHQDISIVEHFARYVIQSPYFSASKCLNFFKSLGYKIGKEKILQLERYAQSAYLFFFIPIFSYTVKDCLQYPRKAYVGDVGMYSSVQKTQDKGRVYENIVFLELKQKMKENQELFYWKNKKGLETDFVIKQGEDVIQLIQVTADITDEKTKNREINAVIGCAQEFNLTQAIIITQSVHTSIVVKDISLQFVPLIQWLQSP
jgi:uncharacterized protein